MRGLGAGTQTVLLAGLLSLAVVAPAGTRQAAGPADVRVSDVAVSDDGRVSVLVAVPALQPSQADLTEAFEIREDGQTRAVDATPIAASDVEVALVVDTSAGQAPEQLRAVRNIAMELALRLPRDSPMALVATGDPPEVAQAASTDVLERAAATGRLQPRGERATLDALVLAVDAFSGRPGARRSVVLVGSGDDEASSATADEVGDRLGAANAALYIIDPAAGRVDRLDDLAASTGGHVVSVTDDRDPLRAATVVLADVLHHYRLTFQARGREDATISIRVATEAVSGATTVDVRLPTSPGQATPGQATVDDTEVLGSPSRSALETSRNWAWLAAVAAAVSAALVFAGAALLDLRRSAGRQPAAAGAGPSGRVGLLQGGRARAAPAGPIVPARVGAAVSAAVAAAGTSLTRVGRALRRTWSALPPAGAVMARRMVAKARPVRPERRPRAPAWPDLAAQVQAETGGDPDALHEAAERIVAARHRTAAALDALGFEGRLAVAFLTPLPVAVGVFRSLVDPAYVDRLTDGLGLVSLLGAAALTAAGALWLRRVAQPPFAALPASWRAYEERMAGEREIADALDLASLYAAAGLDLDSAVARALPDEHHHAHPLVRELRSVDAPEPELLAAVRGRLQAGWVCEADQQAHRIAVSALLPFVVCIGPATAIAALAAGS